MRSHWSTHRANRLSTDNRSTASCWVISPGPWVAGLRIVICAPGANSRRPSFIDFTVRSAGSPGHRRRGRPGWGGSLENACCHNAVSAASLRPVRDLTNCTTPSDAACTACR
jgi:hypothetical protein